MGIAYIGSFTFEETADFVLTSDKFGLGSLQRTFRGKTDLLMKFLAKWPANKADATFKQFKLVTAVASGGGAYTGVTLTFAGLLNGELPKPQLSFGWRRQTASLKKLEGDQTVEVEYRAPTATYRYVTSEKPKKLRYERKLLSEDISWEIRTLRGDRSTRFWEVKEVNRFGGTITYTETQAGRFNYARDIQTADFQADQVGDYWEVTEQVEGVIVEPLRNDLPRFLMPGYFNSAPEAAV